MKIERVPTGIPGLDELIEGGVPKGSTLLLAGGPGTGKTILAIQMIYKALERGENAVLFSLERRGVDKICEQSGQFGMGLEKFMRESRLQVITPAGVRFNLRNLADGVKKAAYKTKCSLVVIDSLTKVEDLGYSSSGEIEDAVLKEILSALEVYEFASLEDLKKNLPNASEKDLNEGLKKLTRMGRVGHYIEVGTPKYYPIEKEAPEVKSRAATRQEISELMTELDELRTLGVTLIYTGESDESGQRITVGGIAEFECDGVIVLKSTEVGDDTVRHLIVKKLRETKIVGGTHHLEFTKEGIKIGGT